MTGYWKRVIARYTDGGLSFGNVPRFMGHSLARLFDCSVITRGTNQAAALQTDPDCLLVPFINPVNSLITNAAVSINVVAFGGNFSIAIYRDTFKSDFSAPGLEFFSLVRELEVGSTEILGLQYTNIPAFQLDQGFYWLAVRTNVGGVFVDGFHHDNGTLGLTGYDPADIFRPTPFLHGLTTGTAFPNWPVLLTVDPKVSQLDYPRIFLEFSRLTDGAP